MAKKTSSQTSSHRSRTFIWLSGLSILGAIFTHSYLLKEHYDLKLGQLNEGSLCNLNALFNCAAVSASRFSELFGIPIALWGAMTNALLLVLLLCFPFTSDENKAAARRNLLILSGFIAAVSVVMGAISSLVLAQFCPFCILAYVLSFLTFGFLWFALPSSQTSNTSSRRLGDFKPLLYVGIGILVLSFITNDQVKKSYGFRNLGTFVKAQVHEWEGNPQVQIDTFEPLSKGPSKEAAAVTVVEFADFRCIHCKHTAPVMKAFAQAHPDARVEFQVWPLDGECNTAISSNNGASCLLARAVYCAENLAQKGWEAHDFIFANFEQHGNLAAVEAQIPKIAEATGISVDEFKTCSDSPEAKSAVEKQAAVGTKLNLRGTPSVFVNGKQLPGGQSLPVLQEAYRRIKTQR